MTNRPQIDGTARDYESLRDAMLALAQHQLPEWTDQSANDPGVVLVELLAAMGDALFYHQDRIAAESYLGTAVERRSALHLLRLIGYELRPPVPASADLTLLYPPTATTAKILNGARFSALDPTTGAAIYYEYVQEDLPSLPLSGPETFADDRKPYKVFRTLPVVQVDKTILPATPENVGSSDGSFGQRYQLASKPVILGSLVVTVDETGTPEVWTRQDSLDDSGPDSKDYRVRFDENDVAWIEFGDGRRGKPPASGTNNIRANYRTGGGVRGNVRAGAIAKIEIADRAPGLARVVNERAATGGADREPIDEAVRRAPRQYRSTGRAVTADDHVAHALSFGVAKAQARARTWNRIELVVAPRGGGLPSLTLKEQLRAYFEPRRMLTAIVEIVDPTYVPLAIRLELAVEPYFSRGQISQRVEEAVRALYAFDATDFGMALYLSKLYEAIEAVTGVDHVTVTTFNRLDAIGTAAMADDGVIRLDTDELALFPAAPDGFWWLKVSGGRPDV